MKNEYYSPEVGIFQLVHEYNIMSDQGATGDNMNPTPDTW